METIIKIEGSSCSNYTNALHAQFHNQMYALVGGADLEKIHVTAELMADWRAHTDVEIDINREVQASADTALMAEKDAERDGHITYLFGRIRMDANSAPIAAQREAASRLVLLVNRYLGLQNEAVDEETIHITGLLTDLAKPANAADLTTLGLTPVTGLLKTANDEYQALRTARATDRATNKLPSSKVVRRETDAIYDKICRLIEASYTLSTVEADQQGIAALITRMNQLITETKTTWRQMEAQRKAAKNKGTAVTE